MGSVLLGMLAGALTTLSPCVLPILPIVLLGALDQHRFAPLALAGGLVATFTALGLLISGAGWAFDVSNNAIRAGAAGMMVLFGLILLSAMLQQRFATLSAPLTDLFNRATGRFSPTGLGSHFALGALLGAVWTPCSGPTLGAAITLAASSETAAKAAAIMLFFSIGACLPLLAIAYGSRQSLRSRREVLANVDRVAKPVLGAVLVVAGLLVLFGFDKALEAAVVDAMPDWLVSLTTRY